MAKKTISEHNAELLKSFAKEMAEAAQADDDLFLLRWDRVSGDYAFRAIGKPIQPIQMEALLNSVLEGMKRNCNANGYWQYVTHEDEPEETDEDLPPWLKN